MTTTHPARLSHKVLGPRRSRGETALGAIGSALVIALLAGYVWQAGGWHGWSVLQIVVLAAIIFDLIFGMFVVSGITARRWYHRRDAAARRFRVEFVIAHAVLYLLPIAALFSPGWAWAVANAGLLLSAAAAVELTPVDLKWTVALGLTLTAGLVNLIWLPLPTTLAWLPVLLFVKILVCFLVPD